MGARWALAAGIAAVTLLGFFFFPGHTYLQSDTQIYLPMFERIWNPAALPGDLAASRPHLAFTIYDEVAIGLRRLTGADFEAILVAQQLLYRAAQVLGLYLLATALPLSPLPAFFVAALVSLGATIAGPAVLAVEYEPVPRGYATGLVFLGIGLAAHRRYLWSCAAGALAVLYHLPTTVPFWLIFIPLVLYRRDYRALAPLGAAAIVLAVAAPLQSGASEGQRLFARVDGDWERLLRLRASYDWVSIWAPGLMPQHVALWAVSLLAFWRIRPHAGRAFLLGLPIIGLLSVPVSYLFLEILKWNAMAQIQPARALLFVTEMAVLLAAAAGITAALHRRYFEAAAWLSLAFLVPMRGRLSDLSGREFCLALALGAIAALAAKRPPLLIPVACSAFLLLPTVGRIRNYPSLETPELQALAAFARTATPADAVFLFADAGRDLAPGIFRARAGRTVFVDWKSGGQVNYYRSLGEEWWTRWQGVRQLQFSPPELPQLRALGISYIVLPPGRALPLPEIFHNAGYVVYRLTNEVGSAEAGAHQGRFHPCHQSVEPSCSAFQAASIAALSPSRMALLLAAGGSFTRDASR